MKIFKVSASCTTYDEYESCIVLAESEAEVRNMFKYEKDTGSTVLKRSYNRTGSLMVFFEESQGELKIEEINLDSKGAILASYIAG